MTQAKILVVEDDSAVRTLIQRFLTRQSYQVEAAADGKSALAIFEQFNPDLVVLDINLPDTSGYTLCQEMQTRTGVFVLMLTSRSGDEDLRQAYAQGADEFITKPFSLGELELRIAAILRRQRPVTTVQEQRLAFNGFSIDPVRREVTLNNEIVPLTALEFNLLHFLASHPGRVWRRAELIEKVWGHAYVGDDRVVDVHIGQIRRKIEVDTSQPALIQTVRGVGYKFEAPTTSTGSGAIAS